MRSQLPFAEPAILLARRKGVKLASRPEPIGGDVTWNFEKYLIDREGRVTARFDPEVTPEDPRITKRIEQLLTAPRPDGA